MNAIVTIEADETQPLAGPHGEGHTIFSTSRQAEFLQNLQLFGNVRVACRVARVSSQTAYRQRRASPALARAWDAALLAARAHAEAALADRALNGVEEKVFYHGEEVATRRRYDSRLLLAHLARLDRLEAREDVVATLGVLDDAIDGLKAGRALEEFVSDTRAPASDDKEAGDRNLSQDRAPSAPSCGTGAEASLQEPAKGPECDCVGARERMDGDAVHHRPGPQGWEPVRNAGDGAGPCCAVPRWPDCLACPHYAPSDGLKARMEEERPGPDELPPPELLGDPDAVRACQAVAFGQEDVKWYCYGEDFVRYRRNDDGQWAPDPASLEAVRLAKEDAAES